MTACSSTASTTDAILRGLEGVPVVRVRLRLGLGLRLRLGLGLRLRVGVRLRLGLRLRLRVGVEHDEGGRTHVDGWRCPGALEP